MTIIVTETMRKRANHYFSNAQYIFYSHKMREHAKVTVEIFLYKDIATLAVDALFGGSYFKEKSELVNSAVTDIEIERRFGCNKCCGTCDKQLENPQFSIVYVFNESVECKPSLGFAICDTCGHDMPGLFTAVIATLHKIWPDCVLQSITRPLGDRA